MKDDEKFIYQISVADLQEVATENIGRRLTKKEIELVSETVGDYINWYDAIEFAINQNVRVK